MAAEGGKSSLLTPKRGILEGITNPWIKPMIHGTEQVGKYDESQRYN